MKRAIILTVAASLTALATITGAATSLAGGSNDPHATAAGHAQPKPRTLSPAPR